MEKYISIEPAPVTEYVIMVEKPTKTTSVVRRAASKYAPAQEPRIYSSKEQAIKVAQIMAEKHGGRFVVFESVADAQAPVREARVRSWR